MLRRSLLRGSMLSGSMLRLLRLLRLLSMHRVLLRPWLTLVRNGLMR